MLVLADDLAGRLETSTPLGTNYPRLSAGCLFLQHPKQCDSMAACMDPGSSQPGRFGRVCCLLAGAHLGSNRSPATIDPVSEVFNFLLAGLDQRPASSGNLDAGVCRQSDRMARAANAPAAGRDTDEGLKEQILKIT